MNCKFCNAELQAGVTHCPECGKEILEETSVQEAAEVPAEESAEEAAAEVIAAEEMPAEDAPAEAAPSKRSVWKTVLAIVGGIALAAVLVGAVIYGMNVGKKNAQSYTVSDSKAARERTTVVANVGDTQLTNSELQVYYWQGINDFYNYMGYYMDPISLGLDLEQPLDEQFYDEENGVTWQQYFLQTALDTWHKYAAMFELAQEEGFQLDEESLAYLETIPADLEQMAVSYGYASAEDMLSQDMGPACDVEGYLKFIKLNFYVSQYFNTVYDRLAPSLEELEVYYADNEDAVLAMGIEKDGSKYVNVRHILFCPEGGTVDEQTGETVYTEAQWEACRQQAQSLLDQWLAEAPTEESFAQLAMEYSQDPGSQSQGGLYTNVTVGQMVAPFENWCFDESRKTGDSGLVKTDYGYHIMYFASSEDTWIADLRAQLVNERSTELIAQTTENYPMKTHMNKIVLGDTTEEE